MPEHRHLLRADRSPRDPCEEAFIRAFAWTVGLIAAAGFAALLIRYFLIEGR